MSATTWMTLSKADLARVHFANFAAQHGIEPRKLGELHTLAKKAFRAGERACNEDSDWAREQEVETGKAFEKFALSLGYSTDWPGLWPVLQKDGRDVYLPDFDA